MAQRETAQGRPELEISDPQTGAIRYLEHGSPHWRIRWHYHDAYELHFIAASSGKVFIGDYIGNFDPGCLILTGPRVPHNWVSDASDVHHELRDHVVHFDHDAITGAAASLPEIGMLLPLLANARYGIEFLRHADAAEKYILQIRESNGAARLGYFFELLDMLARSPHQRLLSTTQIELLVEDALQKKIDLVFDHVVKHYQQKISLAQVATVVGMSEGHFSRFFRRATGNGFNDFVNRFRVAKACDLLSHTSMPITLICYETGFSNIANFNRRFRQYKRMTPSEYRSQARLRYRAAD